MSRKTFFSALAASAAVWLAACGAPEEQAAEDAGAHTIAAEWASARQEFVRTCTEIAAAEAPNTPPETFSAICGCTFDQTAAQYGDEAAWLQALADYDAGKNHSDLESKMHEAGNRCAASLNP